MTDLYKIIVSNQSTHGGTFDWSKHLPKGSKPGKWTSPVSDVAVCSRGYHLTNDVMRWPKVWMQVYRAEGKGDSSTQSDKTAFESVRLIERADDVVPDYWRLVEAFVQELPTIPWFKPTGELALDGVEFKMFETRDAALDAAWDAARDAARAAVRAAALAAAGAAARDAALDAAWDAAGAAARAAARDAARDAAGDAAGAAARAAAWDAALYSRVLVCTGFDLDEKHINHARARMEVWKQGYGLHCDVNGVLYVYRRLA